MSGPGNPEGPSRKRLGPVGRWFARAPQFLYRLRRGWMLGHRFVLIEHTGRKSGLRRTTVLEVIRHDAGSLDVAAAWGERSDWFRNAAAQPSVLVSTGRRRRVPATASVLDREASGDVFRAYALEHRVAAESLSRAFELPFDDLDALADAVPVVRLDLTTNHAG